jgi:hypothetical protein
MKNEVGATQLQNKKWKIMDASCGVQYIPRVLQNKLGHKKAQKGPKHRLEAW